MSARKRSASEVETDFQVETKVDKDVFSFIWTIEDFSEVSQSLEIQPLVVVGGPKNQLSWQLTINPKFKLVDWKEDVNEPYFSINLTHVGPAVNNVKADLEVVLLDVDGKPSPLSEFRPYNEIQDIIDGDDDLNGTNDPQASKPAYGWNKLMLTSSVSEAVENNKLQLLCKVTVYGAPEHTIHGAGASGSTQSNPDSGSTQSNPDSGSHQDAFWTGLGQEDPLLVVMTLVMLLISAVITKF